MINRESRTYSEKASKTRSPTEIGENWSSLEPGLKIGVVVEQDGEGKGEMAVGFFHGVARARGTAAGRDGGSGFRLCTLGLREALHTTRCSVFVFSPLSRCAPRYNGNVFSSNVLFVMSLMEESANAGGLEGRPGGACHGAARRGRVSTLDRS